MGKTLARIIIVSSFFLILMAPPSVSHASKIDYEVIIKKFFEIYKSGNSDKAVDYIFSTNRYVDKESIAQIKNQMRNVKDIVGVYYGYEFINSKKIGDSLICVTYLVKYERQPFRFSFIFYKPLNEWIIFSFTSDDKYDVELKEATKISGQKS